MKYLKILQDYNLKATPQRLCILKILDEHKHPTIDELYEQIRQTCPTLSLATVYKNLSILIENRLVAEISMPNGKNRYDIYDCEHMHLICDSCKCIIDLSSEDAKMKEFSEHLSQIMGGKIKNLRIVANLNSCQKCQKSS